METYLTSCAVEGKQLDVTSQTDIWNGKFCSFLINTQKIGFSWFGASQNIS